MHFRVYGYVFSAWGFCIQGRGLLYLRFSVYVLATHIKMIFSEEANGLLVGHAIWHSLLQPRSSSMTGYRLRVLIGCLLCRFKVIQLEGFNKNSLLFEMGPFKCYVTLFSWKFDPHPSPRNALNNVEPDAFVTLFSGNSDTPHPICVT